MGKQSLKFVSSFVVFLFLILPLSALYAQESGRSTAKSKKGEPLPAASTAAKSAAKKTSGSTGTSMSTYSDPTKSSSSSAAKSESKSPRNALPAYYKDVVTETQKAKIYEIQKQYNEKIRPLEAQVEALKLQRNEKVRNVLDASQQKEVDKKQQAAKAAREVKSIQRKAAGTTVGISDLDALTDDEYVAGAETDYEMGNPESKAKN